MVKNIVKTIILFFITIALSTNPLAAPAPDLGFAELVEKLSPAVVNISTITKMQKNKFGRLPFPEGSPFQDFNDFFERFGMPPGFDMEDDGKKVVSLGSGFLIDPTGYIVTNYHVIQDADEINITFNNDKKLKAKLIGTDNKTDLAILKVTSEKPLPFVKFGDSDESRVGDWVIAIGNPFGLGGTVTVGVVSAKARDINAGPFDDFIQTDAAINKGNSGGPMFNIKGEVIGVNTAIYSPSGGSVGIGFATPSAMIKNIVEHLKRGEKIKRSWLGVKIQPVTDDIADSLGLKEAKGALIVDVTAASPAAKAGLKTGDVILAIGNNEINSLRKLPRIVAETLPGSKVDFAVMRKSERKIISVTLEQLPEEPKQLAVNDNDNKQVAPNKTQVTLLGMGLVNLTPDLKTSLGLDKNLTGCLILQVDPKSEAFKKGIRKGDVISGANQEAVTNIDDLKKLIDKTKTSGRKAILLLLVRGSQSMFLPVPIS